VGGHYRGRLSPYFSATFQAESTWYEADFAFESSNIVGMGISPELALSRSVIIPLQIKYYFGDFQGLETGMGFSVVW
jgi:hypothetical protein